MSEATPRFALPFIIPGQAQKELFHNEALTGIDLMLHPAVEADPLAVPPSNPTEGAIWIVAAGASGAWSANVGSLAMWTAGGWRFGAPSAGLTVWNKAAGYAVRWDGTAWNGGEVDVASLRVGGQQVVAARQPTVANPSGGTTIDAESRTAIEGVIAALMSHGLIE